MELLRFKQARGRGASLVFERAPANVRSGQAEDALNDTSDKDLSKVPEVTLIFWIIKIAATTLGETGGDAVSMSMGLGCVRAAMVFGALLALIVAAYYGTRISRTVLFWAAFVLTRPLGAVLGDFLDKPIGAGGLALSRYTASIVILMLMVACIVFVPQRGGKKGH